MSKAIVRDVLQRAPVKARLLSVAQTAIMLGVGTSTVYKLIAGKKLAAIKIGDRSLIKVETIDKFIASQPAATATPRRTPRKRTNHRTQTPD
jgi:excisionase family DNA binding protein